MKVVLVAQAYPPYPMVGALRARKIARAFRDAGHDVVVITERLAPELERRREQEPGIEVVALALGARYRERVTQAVSWVRRSRASAQAPTPARAGRESLAVPAAPATATAPRGGGLRRLILALLWLPDDEQRFILPALRAARRHAHDGALVYTTAPPWSAHVVGLALRRRKRVRWVADFRDPWLDLIDHDAGRPRSAVTDRWLLRLERAVLRVADFVVAVAPKTSAALAAKLPAEERGKVVLARNGVDQTLPVRTAREPGPFRIVYAGSFYSDRDPHLFLTALARLRERRPIGTDALRVELAGSCRFMAAESIEDFVRDLGLDDLVHFHDWMPQSEAQRLVATADLLLILARGMTLQVPNKLYDYLGTRIPIFAWADEDGETAAVLRSLEGHFVVTGSDVDDMAATIERALTGTPLAACSAAQDRLVEEWSTERQMRLLVEAVTS